jgi:hypothetical protein
MLFVACRPLHVVRCMSSPLHVVRCMLSPLHVVRCSFPLRPTPIAAAAVHLPTSAARGEPHGAPTHQSPTQYRTAANCADRIGADGSAATRRRRPRTKHARAQRACASTIHARAQRTREHSIRASTPHADAKGRGAQPLIARREADAQPRNHRRARLQRTDHSADEALSGGRRRGLAGGGRASQAPAHAWQRDGRMRYEAAVRGADAKPGRGPRRDRRGGRALVKAQEGGVVAGLGDKGGLTPGAGVARGEPSLASRCGCGGWAESRRRRGRGEPTDVAGVSPVPVQTWQGRLPGCAAGQSDRGTRRHRA